MRWIKVNIRFITNAVIKAAAIPATKLVTLPVSLFVTLFVTLFVKKRNTVEESNGNSNT